MGSAREDARMIRRDVTWRWSDVEATTTATETQLRHRPSGAQLTVRAGRLLGGNGYTTADAVARRDLARVGASVRLRQKGRYLVHAAGVVDPWGRAWLLSGDSGAGKSTLAYALARAGWSVLGDDGVLIEVVGGNVVAHPWKDPLNVSRTLAPDFPELQQHAPRARLGDPRQRVPMALPLGRSAAVAAVIMLERGETHAVESIGPLEALAVLIRQSPAVMIDDDHARAHLQTLTRAAALLCFRVQHTPAELHTISTILCDLLR